MMWWDEVRNEADQASFMQSFADDAVCIGSRGTRLEGPEAIFAYARNSDRFSSDWSLRSLLLVEDEDRFAVEWLFEGTHDRDSALIGRATRRRYSFPGTSIGLRRDQRIVRQADYGDTLGFLVSAGMVRWPPSAD